jgi:hypothetical protein
VVGEHLLIDCCPLGIFGCVGPHSTVLYLVDDTPHSDWVWLAVWAEFINIV